MVFPIRGSFTGSYRVEVSGWDVTETFFVEKTELEWNEETGKRVFLNRALPPGALIFVRLLQATLSVRPCPVAYETELLSTSADERHEFKLRQVVHPITAEAESATGPENSAENPTERVGSEK